MAVSNDLTIQQGRTFTLVLRWETMPFVKVPITAVSFASGSPRITAAAHSAPDGWRAAVLGVRGPKQLNASANPPRPGDFHALTLIDPNTVEFNEITPVDDNGQDWPAYVSGGFLVYYTPMNLTGQTGRMKIKDKVGGVVLASTEEADSPLNVLKIATDNDAKTIMLTIDASDTEELSWTRTNAVYDLEMVSSDTEPVVTALLSGNVFLSKEITS